MDNLNYDYEGSDRSNRLLRVTDGEKDSKGFKDTGETGRIYGRMRLET